MKKLISKTERKKINQRNQFIAGSILVLLMVFSTVAYSFMDNNRSSDSSASSSIVYNGVAFSNTNNYFVGEKYGNKIILLNNPKEQFSFPVELNLSLSDYSGLPLYISSEDYLSAAEINQNFDSYNSIVERTQMACYDEQNCSEDFPLKDCNSNLVVIRYSKEPSILSLNKCVFISGPEENITYITDKFIMKLFQI